MAATAAARARVDLAVRRVTASRPAARSTGVTRFALSLAAPFDEREIGVLLRDATFPGDVRLSLERDPSPLAAATIEGDTHQLIVARDRTSGVVAGVAARSVRDMYVNGGVARVGYLGQLRALMDAGFAFCRDLHDQGDAPCYLTSIVAGNHAARRLLVGRRSPTAPRFVALETLRTFVIAVERRRSVPAVPGVHLEVGSDARAGDIAACLDRNLRRYQFSPRWTVEDLRSDRTRDLLPEHFVLAVLGNRVVGCVARWDQRGFKQVVVRGYSTRLARWRPLANLAGRWVGLPTLPAVGQSLRFAYLSHVAVDDDRADVLAALVAAQCGWARTMGLSHVVTSFVSRHPFHDTLARRFRHRAYGSALYLAFWPDGEPFVHGLSARILQPEVAVL